MQVEAVKDTLKPEVGSSSMLDVTVKGGLKLYVLLHVSHIQSVRQHFVRLPVLSKWQFRNCPHRYIFNSGFMYCRNLSQRNFALYPVSCGKRCIRA